MVLISACIALFPDVWLILGKDIEQVPSIKEAHHVSTKKKSEHKSKAMDSNDEASDDSDKDMTYCPPPKRKRTESDISDLSSEYDTSDWSMEELSLDCCGTFSEKIVTRSMTAQKVSDGQKSRQVTVDKSTKLKKVKQKRAQKTSAKTIHDHECTQEQRMGMKDVATTEEEKHNKGMHGYARVCMTQRTVGISVEVGTAAYAN